MSIEIAMADEEFELDEGPQPRECPIQLISRKESIDPEPRSVPVPFPYPEKEKQKKEKKKKRILTGQRLNGEFLNPDRLNAFVKKKTLDPEEYVEPCSLAAPTLNSTLYHERNLRDLQTSEFDSNTITLDDKSKRYIAKVMDIDPQEKKYEDLIPVQVPTPRKPRLVRKQINPKWKKSLNNAPPFEDPLLPDQEPKVLRPEPFYFENTLTPQPKTPALVRPLSHYSNELF